MRRRIGPWRPAAAERFEAFAQLGRFAADFVDAVYQLAKLHHFIPIHAWTQCNRYSVDRSYWGARLSGGRGSDTVNVAPAPGWLSTRISP